MERSFDANRVHGFVVIVGVADSRPLHQVSVALRFVLFRLRPSGITGALMCW